MAETKTEETKAAAKAARGAAKGGSGKPERKKRKKGPIEQLHPQAAKVREVFFSDTPLGAFLWCALVCALVAILVWFFVFSPYGAPAAPVYAGF